ncbi:hypothetical protein [Aeromonas hydrophila]|uniref:hypothetical protein n=1 Tax=Aeromonas hydrophila TaxID=644 RepID=UPI0038CF4947
MQLQEVSNVNAAKSGPQREKQSSAAVHLLGAMCVIVALTVTIGLARCEAFTGVTVTNNPQNPHAHYTAIRSLDTTSTTPNRCAGLWYCGLRMFSMSDAWPSDYPNGYDTEDRSDDWGVCLTDQQNATMGDVGKCLIANHISTETVVSDYLPDRYPVNDHALACLAYSNQGKYDASRGRVHCAPVGGPLSTCKFDAPSLSGEFRGSAGVINRTEVDLGAVNITCDADLTLVAGAGGTDGGPIPMVQGSTRDPRNVATVDLGAGEGNALTIKAKQGVATRINVKAFVSGNYESGEVKGTGTITIGTP